MKLNSPSINIFVTMLLLALLLTSCLKWSATSEGGVRITKPQKFLYNKSKFANEERLKIDTTVVYHITSEYDWRGTWPGKPEPCQFLRFFGTGQVLFYYCGRRPMDSLVNNKLAGQPGYYMIHGKRIQIHRWSLTNGGQLEKYFGIIREDKSIKFFEQAVRTCHGSFNCLEKQNMYSVWEKSATPKLIYFKPSF